MSWLDSLMERITGRGTKIVGSGHAPADTQPPTGDPELSEELQADYGRETPEAQPPDETVPDPDVPPDPR